MSNFLNHNSAPSSLYTKSSPHLVSSTSSSDWSAIFLSPFHVSLTTKFLLQRSIAQVLLKTTTTTQLTNSQSSLLMTLFSSSVDKHFFPTSAFQSRNPFRKAKACRGFPFPRPEKKSILKENLRKGITKVCIYIYFEREKGSWRKIIRRKIGESWRASAADINDLATTTLRLLMAFDLRFCGSWPRLAGQLKDSLGSH